MEWLDVSLAWFAGRPLAATLAATVALVLLAWAAYWLTRRLLLRVIRRFAKGTATQWDDALVARRVFDRAAHVVPAAIVYFGVPLVPGLPAALATLSRNVAAALMVFAVMLALVALLAATNDIYERSAHARERPIKGYVQVAQILLAILGTVLVLATLMDRSPLLFLSGFGAMTAVLLLVFRDTLLSLVASVKFGAQDMLRVCDWVEMPQYGADGDVIDIALHTVRVQNWDKTITTIPTHRFIADSFRNWRGMQEAGGRRIKRAIHIDTASIRFLDDAQLERFRDFKLLEDYIARKEQELAEYNARFPDPGANTNARRLTNIGTFRAYVVNYLRHHPLIHDEMTLLVRQLQPGPEGLPLEIYAFSRDTRWAEYENLQADIFDHLLAILPQFGLRAFQQPTGADLAALRGGGEPARGREVAS